MATNLERKVSCLPLHPRADSVEVIIIQIVTEAKDPPFNETEPKNPPSGSTGWSQTPPVADINPVYGASAAGCFVAPLFSRAPRSRCFKKDSAGAVILQPRAMQLSSKAVHMFMIDVHNPCELMSLGKYGSFQPHRAIF